MSGTAEKTLLDRLERRFGGLAIPRITWVLVVGQGLAFLTTMAEPAALERFMLVPALVMQGEVWRLVSFVFMAPATNPLFAFFALYLLLMMGNALETTWGAFRYNLFLLLGYVCTVVAAFLPMLVPGGGVYLLVPTLNVVWMSTVFLAFAALFPDFQLLLFFVLPVKVRWLAWLTWAGYGYIFVTGEWPVRLSIVAALVGYLVFFARDHLASLKDGDRRRRHAARFAAERAETAREESAAFHTCAECGVTDKSDPTMDFRYCDDCEGHVGFCRDHIRAHAHRRASEA